MKKAIVIIGILGFVLLFNRCANEVAGNKKDLDENMLDMMMYHDNLGQYLRKGDADYATWLLEGLDSSLKVVSAMFDEHRKLDDPFEKFNQKLLAPPIKDIRNALKQNNFPAAISAYRVLTKNCNKCHLDHEIDKVVVDWTNSSAH